jgi:hypothetical protein
MLLPKAQAVTIRQFAPLPAPGDIVYSRFPVVKGVPADKPRPALVAALIEFDDGVLGVRVAYGRSKKVGELHAGEFAITPVDGAAYGHAGLSYPTKFDLRKQEYLPYTDQWFGVPPGKPYGQSPKLGVLHPSLFRRAKAAHDAVRGLE